MGLRKPRVQSVIDQMTPEQQKALQGWMLENLTYAAIAQKLKDQFRVNVSRSSLSNYYQRVGSALVKPATAADGTQTVEVPSGWEVLISAGPPLKISVRPPTR